MDIISEFVRTRVRLVDPVEPFVLFFCDLAPLQMSVLEFRRGQVKNEHDLLSDLRIDRDPTSVRLVNNFVLIEHLKSESDLIRHG